MISRKSLATGAAALAFAGAATAQTADEPPEAGAAGAQPGYEEFEDEDSQTIVVTGARPRGSVIGDIPPENTLTARDVMATGAADINELLEALEPQIGSARGRGGGRPIMLLNGQRVSSFRELHDIPTEAISRVEILPEEVALKYGYRADQRVVNIILRDRFRSTVARLEGTTATEGGYVGGEADLTRLIIGENSRTTLDLDIEANSPLTENERDILLQDTPANPDIDPRRARTLVGSRREVTVTATHNRQLGSVGATGNLEFQRSEGRSLIGLGDTLLEPLARNTTRDSAHAGTVLNGNFSDWRWSVTGNADAARNVTRTDRDATENGDRAVTKTFSTDIDAVANGTLFRLPAGDAGATVRVGASTLHLDSDRGAADTIISTSLGRTRAARRPISIFRCRAGTATSDRSATSLQRQCRGRAAVGLRHPYDPRSGRKLGAVAAARPDRQLDQGRWRADGPATRRPGAGDAGHAHLRLHERRDGAGHRNYRRKSRSRSRPAQRAQARRELEAVRGNRPQAARRICASRRSTTRFPAFPARAKRWRQLFPNGSSAIPTASWSASTCAR
jgi:hypothetical protein